MSDKPEDVSHGSEKPEQERVKGKGSTEDNAEGYALTLVGAGLTFEREVPKPVALQIINVVLGGSGAKVAFDRGREGSDDPERTEPRGGTRLSLREFLDAAEAKTNPKKIVAIAEYQSQVADENTFTRESIQGKFRTAEEPTPRNYPRDFREAIASGWIAESHDASGEFYVTGTGKNAVSSKFADGVKKTRRRRRSAKKATTSANREE